MRATMHHRQLDSYTNLIVTHLEGNLEIPEETFELRRLEAH